MKSVSLMLKITIAFVIASIATLVFIYQVFYALFEKRMLEAERDKAVLIAKTIEPMIGMNYYLGLNDEIKQLASQSIDNSLILSLRIIIKDQELFFLEYDEEKEHMHIQYPIKDPISKEPIGIIDVSYKLENFYQAFDEIKHKMFDYLALLGVAFLLFGLLIRRLLYPLNQIAQTVKSYQPGSIINFSSIRTEPETAAIISAFKKMLSNIREYTTLLERYKYAVDESAIVSKTNIYGQITYVNDEFCLASGYSKEELIGKQHNIVRHPDMQSETFATLWQTLAEKKVWKGVIKNRHKTGMPYYVKATIVPIFDERGETVEYIGIRHDITQIIQQQEQIQRQTTDPLTGLPNRIKLEEDLKGSAAPKFALIALENFHIIKDYYGYEMGKQTLIQMAEMLHLHSKEQNASVYKLSSGEFGLLAGDNMDVAGFTRMCKEVLQKMDDYIIYIDDISFNMQAIAGISYSQNRTFSNASLAFYHARETGQSSVVYEETENLIESYKNNLEWTKRIKEALDDERIVIYVQPIVDAKNLEIVKYECLVRLIDENDTVILPFHFLDIAKRSKLYHGLTQKIITLAFEAFSKLPGKHFTINLTVDDIVHLDTMLFLEEKLKEYALASRLTIEIVESEEIENFDEVSVFITKMKSLGCEIAIDDFGTGYSNFAYLMQLDVDYIKIDGSLIKYIDSDVNSQIISRTIIDFAKQLKIKTVAEYVHTQSVMSYIQEMGIDYLQGYHLGKPVDIETLSKTEGRDWQSNYLLNKSLTFT